jgi:hypothetical protein
MAAEQIARRAGRCRTHPRLNADSMLCAVAVYRGSWGQPDVKFATDVVATAAKGDAPNFDMPPGTSTAIFDIADDLPSDSTAPIVDITTTFAEQARGWSSTLFPTKSKPSSEQSERTVASTPPAAEQPSPTSPAPFPFKSSPQGHVLFVPRVGAERPQ